MNPDFAQDRKESEDLERYRLFFDLFDAIPGTLVR